MIKNRLNNIRKINSRIASKQQQLQMLETTRGSLPSFNTDDRVSNSDISDRTADTALKIIELQQEIAEEINRFLMLQNKYRKLFNRLGGDYATLMELRYLCNVKWEIISATLHISMQHTYRLHGEALQKLREILKDESK